MSTVFCPTCGDDVDSTHSGCGRADCPYKDTDVPTEHVVRHVGEEVKPEKEISRRDKFGYWEEYGKKIDAGEKPETPPPPPPWKKS